MGSTTIKRRLGRGALATLALAVGTLASAALAAQDFDVKQGPFGGGSVGNRSYRIVADNGMHISRIETVVVNQPVALRLQFANAERTVTKYSSWIGWTGTHAGTRQDWEIPANRYVAKIDVRKSRTSGEIRQLVVHLDDGTFKRFGPTDSGDTQQTLALDGHEIAGIHGEHFPLIETVGGFLRPAWEQQMPLWTGRTKRVGSRISAGVQASISRIDVEYEPVNGLGYLRGLRFGLRDLHGVETGSTEWLGATVARPRESLAIEVGDGLRDLSFTHDGRFVIGMTFRTYGGKTLTFGATTGTTVTITPLANHEIVGAFGERYRGVYVSAFGLLQRPIAGRHWKLGAGCVSRSKPSLVLPNRLVVGMKPSVAARLDGDANQVGALMIGFQQLRLSIGLCTLFTRSDLLFPMTTDARGYGYHWMQLPADWKLVGAKLFTQALLVEKDGPVLGAIVLTDGFASMVGGI